ncbi:uncharacterized protein LOC118671356 isoform X2 [Myotis myotis]|uniref:uncharacterized protein LOC118671356 isoform X2 n=1 Tax=Myotis myotis TaxID=51298 RepID=UPI0017495D8F|nr:uncharacterized protein LOC118671356 isoform X2 [Myotis myotis]
MGKLSHSTLGLGGGIRALPGAKPTAPGGTPFSPPSPAFAAHSRWQGGSSGAHGLDGLRLRWVQVRRLPSRRAGTQGLGWRDFWKQELARGTERERDALAGCPQPPKQLWEGARGSLTAREDIGSWSRGRRNHELLPVSWGQNTYFTGLLRRLNEMH